VAVTLAMWGVDGALGEGAEVTSVSGGEVETPVVADGGRPESRIVEIAEAGKGVGTDGAHAAITTTSTRPPAGTSELQRTAPLRVLRTTSRLASTIAQPFDSGLELGVT
jgi:hypothetical protein